MIAPRLGPPCQCERCTVANVTERQRPIGLDLHGRDLARWWEQLEKAQATMRDLFRRRRMPPAMLAGKSEDR